MHVHLSRTRFPQRRISVFAPLGGAAVRAQQAPSPGTPEGLQTPQSSPHGPSPKLAGPLDCTRTFPPSSYPPPHRLGHPSAVTHSDRSSAAAAPADGPPRRATVSPPATALLQLQLQAALLPPVEIASPWKAGLHPRAGGYDSVEGSVPPGPRDAVERVPPRPDGVEAVFSLGGTDGFDSIRPPRDACGGPGSTPAQDTHIGGKPPHSMRWGDPERRS